MSNQMAQLQEATIKRSANVAYADDRLAVGPLPNKRSREEEPHRVSRSIAAAEVEERERNTIERRIREAHLPRTKTLESLITPSRRM